MPPPHFLVVNIWWLHEQSLTLEWNTRLVLSWLNCLSNPLEIQILYTISYRTLFRGFKNIYVEYCRMTNIWYPKSLVLSIGRILAG